MTQLLISVKNTEESLIALHAGADIIDLKDPNIGALGALDLVTSKKIVYAINGRAILSATIGEHHANVTELVNAIYSYHQMGVDIIKLAVNDLFMHPEFETKIAKITSKNIKLVAVFFADETINWSLLTQISALNFFGAMIDTKQKNKDLTLIITTNELQIFMQSCLINNLKFGFAGSLRLQHIEQLILFNPTYMGFRGGVCKAFERESILLPQSVGEIKKLLFKHNNFALIGQ